LDNKRALVLVLHGCAQTAGGDVINGSGDAGYNWKAVADQYGAVILAPNATGNVYGTHCWDWAATNRSRSYGHTAVLLDLINRFIQNPHMRSIRSRSTWPACLRAAPRPWCWAAPRPRSSPAWACLPPRRRA